MNNKNYLIALNQMNGIGPRTIQKLIERWPALEELFRLSLAEMLASGLTPRLSQCIKNFPIEQIEADLRWAEKPNHHLLCWDDPQYPALLKEIYDPPAVLYLQGNLDCLQHKTVAMVGSRKPSVTGSENAFRFAKELAAQKITIVSGLALGIDAQAHQGALASGGRTIAVMATGIDRIYPNKHRQLAEEICVNGLVITEFSLKTAPNAGHFPRRNRIISGLSLITLVVEAAIRSGSLITARQALEQNRDVLAIPGSINNPMARGCHYLLQQGAKLVTSSQDVTDELGLTSVIQTQPKLEVSLASDNKNLVKCIGFDLTTVDEILLRSGLNIEDVVCGLAILELEGIVKAVAGGYMRV